MVRISSSDDKFDALLRSSVCFVGTEICCDFSARRSCGVSGKKFFGVSMMFEQNGAASFLSLIGISFVKSRDHVEDIWEMKQRCVKNRKESAG